MSATTTGMSLTYDGVLKFRRTPHRHPHHSLIAGVIPSQTSQDSLASRSANQDISVHLSEDWDLWSDGSKTQS